MPLNSQPYKGYLSFQIPFQVRLLARMPTGRPKSVIASLWILWKWGAFFTRVGIFYLFMSNHISRQVRTESTWLARISQLIGYQVTGLLPVQNSSSFVALLWEPIPWSYVHHGRSQAAVQHQTIVETLFSDVECHLFLVSKFLRVGIVMYPHWKFSLARLDNIPVCSFLQSSSISLSTHHVR